MAIGRVLTSAVVAVVIWQLIWLIGCVSPVVLASPIDSASALYELARSGLLLRDTASSLYRTGAAVVISGAIAIPLALTLVLIPTLASLVNPIIGFLRSVPPVVMYPPLVVALGPFDSARIVTAALGGMLVMTTIIASMSSGLSSDRCRFLVSHSVPTRAVFFRVAVVESLPSIVAALQTGSSLAFVFVVVTELFMASDYGLGSRIQFAHMTGNPAQAYGALVMLGVCGSIISMSFEVARRRVSSFVTY
jgi:ABC-type nitrate/sulfonate/bicarbonate transport system permease component